MSDPVIAVTAIANATGAAMNLAATSVNAVDWNRMDDKKMHKEMCRTTNKFNTTKKLNPFLSDLLLLSSELVTDNTASTAKESKHKEELQRSLNVLIKMLASSSQKNNVNTKRIIQLCTRDIRNNLNLCFKEDAVSEPLIKEIQKKISDIIIIASSMDEEVMNMKKEFYNSYQLSTSKDSTLKTNIKEQPLKKQTRLEKTKTVKHKVDTIINSDIVDDVLDIAAATADSIGGEKGQSAAKVISRGRSTLRENYTKMSNKLDSVLNAVETNNITQPQHSKPTTTDINTDIPQPNFCIKAEKF